MTEGPKTAIKRTLEAITEGSDLRQWPLVAAAFAAEVELDYGHPEKITPEGIIARWQPLLGSFDRTEHVVSEVHIDVVGDTAQTRSRFRASHELAGAPGGDRWVLEGRYEHELIRGSRGWQVTRMKMIPGQSTGNAQLPEFIQKTLQAKLPPDVRPSSVRPIESERVSFDSHGVKLVGILYRPAAAERSPKLPAIVVNGTWTSVKEQMSALYAQRLAERGYLALAFDFRGFGESDGAPRDHESPRLKMEDLRSAVRFLGSLPAVDPQRIGALGVCAGAGYAAWLSAEVPAVKSLVLVAPWLHDAELVKAVFGGPEGVQKRLAAAATAEERHRRTQEVSYVPMASAADPDAAMFGTYDYYLNPRRGRIPQWGARFAVMGWKDWLTFDGVALGPKVRAPTRIVHSEAAAIPVGARTFYEHLRVPKSILWTDGIQFDFYDQQPQVARAIDSASEHFQATLGMSPTA